jgi:hypothetical protein
MKEPDFSKRQLLQIMNEPDLNMKEPDFSKRMSSRNMKESDFNKKKKTKPLKQKMNHCEKI